MLSLLLNNFKLVGAVAAIVGVLLGGIYYGKQQYSAGYVASTAIWEAKTAKLKAEASETLVAETRRVLEVEREAQRAANTATSGLLTRNASILDDRDAAIAALTLRLRNNPTQCGSSGSSPTAENNGAGAITPAAGGLWISEENARSLINLAVEADKLNAQYVAIQSYLDMIGM